MGMRSRQVLKGGGVVFVHESSSTSSLIPLAGPKYQTRSMALIGTSDIRHTDMHSTGISH